DAGGQPPLPGPHGRGRLDSQPDDVVDYRNEQDDPQVLWAEPPVEQPARGEEECVLARPPGGQVVDRQHHRQEDEEVLAGEDHGGSPSPRRLSSSASRSRSHSESVLAPTAFRWIRSAK